jgi:hypothetical protein
MLIASTERLTLDVIRRDDIRRTVTTARAARWLELGATGNIRLSICRLMHHRIRGDWLARKACHWPSRFAECASTNLTIRRLRTDSFVSLQTGFVFPGGS